MTSGTRRETSAGGVVVRRDGNRWLALLIRDPYGNWGLPKGHLESEETEAQAALREVAEETGLHDLELAAELPVIDWYFRRGSELIHKYCRFYLMESRDGDPVPEAEEGITECRWLPMDEAVEKVTYDNARGVIEAARVTLESRDEGDADG